MKESFESSGELGKERRLLEFRASVDHRLMSETVMEMANRYPSLGVTTLGQSILGKSIPVLQIGQGRKRLIYIGAHHGMEWITSAILLRFVNEYCELLKCGSVAEGVPVRVLDETRSICVIPMLNPDGVDYAIHGVEEDNPMYERVLSMNGGSKDFSHWQANARGVDLNHNYNAGFSEYKSMEPDLGISCGAPTRYSGECPESEPETGYLCNYLRFQKEYHLAMTFHTQGEEIYYTSGDKTAPRSEVIGKYLAGLCEYRLAKPEGPAAYGGFTDWFIREFDRPSFTIECGKGKNPLPFSDFPMLYIRLRKLLFTAPMLI